MRNGERLWSKISFWSWTYLGLCQIFQDLFLEETIDEWVTKSARAINLLRAEIKYGGNSDPNLSHGGMMRKSHVSSAWVFAEQTAGPVAWHREMLILKG